LAHEKEPPSFSRKLLLLPALAYTLLVSLFYFSKDSTPIHRTPQETEPDSDGNRSQNVPANPVRVIVESFPPKPVPTDKEKTENNVKKRWKIAKGILEVLTLIGLWVYVLETKKTNHLTKEALSDARHNFTQDQEPVIWITPNPASFGLNKALNWNFNYTNYGRSPALNMHLCAHPLFGTSAYAVSQANPPSMDYCKGSRESTSVVPSGYPGFVTMHTDRPLTQPDISAIEQDGGLVAVGVFEYQDASGDSYVSTFCSYRLKSGAIAHCEKYNEYRRTDPK
jgi:hypothetical protein